MIPNIIFIGDEDLMSDHHRLWRDQYNNRALSIKHKKEISRKIKTFLDIADNSEREGQINAMIGCFNYLSDEGYLIMNDHPMLFVCVVNKIAEFQDEVPELFEQLNPTTRQFIYAASGIKCD